MKVLTFLLILTLSQQIYAPPFYYDKNFERHSRMLENLDKTNERNLFLEKLAISESAGKYTVWNKHGYIGKYQFGISARKATGYGHINFYDFIKKPSIWTPEDQEAAMLLLMEKNQSHLIEIIKYVEGNEIIVKGTRITKSGVLSAAHLAGYGGVKRYFKNEYNPKDIYGTSLENYLVKFSGYQF